MHFLARLILALTFVLPLAPAMAQQPPSQQVHPFAHQGVKEDAQRYEAYLKSNWKLSGKSAADLRRDGERALRSDPRSASRNFAGAVVADNRDADAWIGLARALLAIPADPNKDSERYDLPVNASGAAYIGYERAKDDPQRARALAVLGDALQRRSYWRPAIDALKTSLALADNGAVRETYDKLRAEHGFRMTDYRAEAETAAPRLCLQFSESLARGQVDFAKFVSVDGRDPQSVSAENEQLCIDGLSHGQRYHVQVRAGLPSAVEEDLQKNIDIAVYVPDRKPFVRFSGKSYVLPSRGQQGIPLVSVNTARVEVEVYRIGDRNLVGALESGDFQRQLQGYELEQIRSRTGEKIFTGSMDVPQKLNEEMTTALPVTDAVGTLKPGVYVMIAKPSQKSRDDYNTEATQWFIVSDLGLTAFSGDDGVHAFVRSLADANPSADVNVKLIARNNEVLGTAKTDTRGYARFEAGLSRGEGGLQPALLVAESALGEYAFLDLTTGAFDLTDRGVKGREPPGPLDGFVYTERGVYRPGEDVHIAALVRDAAGKAATLPVTLIVSRPDGVEHSRYTLKDRGLGGRDITLPLAPSSMTGTWRAKLHTDPDKDPITQVAFLVEDFVPERLDLKLEPPAAALSPQEAQTIKATGRYLYGPPAADLAIEGDIIVKASSKDVPGYPGFQFGQADETIEPVRKPLDAATTTDANGIAEVAVTLPPVPQTSKPLEASVILRLRESGGRTIERSVTIPVDLHQARIGIKPLFKGTELDEKQTASFEVVVLDGDGKRVAAEGLNWVLNRLDTNWQWYRRDGQWNYEAVTLTRKVADGTFNATADGAFAKIDANVDWGRYKLEITSADPSGPAASVAFNAGWYTASSEAESPEVLDVALDRASYKPGETAKLRIVTKQGGKALISVLSSGLLSQQEIDVPNGGGEADVEVGENWGAGAYVTAMLYRPLDESLKRMPSRAIGVQWLGLDQAPNTLSVSIQTPEKIKSGTTLTVPVKIDGLKAGEEAYVTLAAVDLGILNLTRFQTPAPENWFYAQRRMGLEIRDFYGRLIDGMRAERGTLRSGGDGGADMGLQGSPPVEETVALFSGIVSVGADGTAKVDFDVPDFNGTVRVMAVAWSADKLGHGQGDVIVRDAVALTASGPRFLTLGDEAHLDIAAHNVEGPEAAYKLELTSGDKAVHTASLDLKEGERRSEQVAVKPTSVGLVEYDIRVTGPNGIDVKRHLTFDVKPPAGDIKRTTIASLKPGGSISLNPDLVRDMIAPRTRVSISVGPIATLDIPALLTALDRYPYGCAEQTVSRALPLVYANAVAAQLGIAPDKELKERVQKAVDRVFEMQDSSGAFGVWGPSTTDLWLTGYVTDFLTRAKEQGFAVNPQGFNQALDRLQNFIAYAEDFQTGGEDRAYALYVLARNGRAPIGDLRYYADTRLDRFSTPLARAQLGAALAMMGDRTRAETAFASALDALDLPEATGLGGYRADYGSDLRDSAALVTLASETRVSNVEAPKLVNVIAKAYVGRSYTSTQEQAWLLLAANALAEEGRDLKLIVNGAPVVGAVTRAMSAEELLKSPLTVANDGAAPVDAVVSVIGSSLTAEPAVSKGFTVERSYYKLDGTPVDLKSATGGAAQIAQNERLVAVVKVEAKVPGGRVLLVDRLPAGFEIDNPHLVDSGDVKALDWLKTTVQPEHSEFRDDRFVAAFNFSGASVEQPSAEGESTPDGQANTKGPATSATVAYMVRAVTPGAFVHPAATVEDMYRPERHARTAAGRLTVTADK
ncbi:MAG: alpha-2-macroglobulin family protein [Hyphomicrobium sp.]|uniref:alpha-2-macroglobulin family protein n=1 Tax=Hyphomicrobium sp. TaxID=82 RepID=UPI0013269B23|nr:alpha-2-macroglobulin [Hyphomicrobium sp.]KAB2937372.1 MAG: alpha-2-macroglobulin family protein [Hyphomicrobium sp.]MBZ0208095.1 alpha-2-macroglobulin family protein [Hyphomicrobium sp.]